MSFATLLTAILTTFVGRLLAAFGISILTYTGSELLQQKLIDLLLSNLHNVPPAALQLFYMAGGGVVLNWLLGAFTFMMGWGAVSKISSVFDSK